MQEHIDTIVSKLPNGISKTGMKEIIDLVEGAIQDQVDTETKMLETKVSGFLRTKIDELKEVARKEFESENSNYRAAKIYETIKTLIASDLSEEDHESVSAPYKEKVEEMEQTLKTVNENYTKVENENRLLEGQVNQLQHEVNDLVNENVELGEQAQVLEEQASLPFKTSETAVVITNNTDRSSPSVDIDNQFLTEDVVRLSQLLKEEN